MFLYAKDQSYVYIFFQNVACKIFNNLFQNSELSELSHLDFFFQEYLKCQWDKLCYQPLFHF